MTDRPTTRRRLLLGIGTATTIALAGCGDGDTTTEDGGNGVPDETTDLGNLPDETTDPGVDTPEETTEPGTETTESETETETTEEETDTETDTETAAESRLRVAHTSPNAPDVDVYVDGSAVLETVPFGAVSEYLDVSADDHDVMITPAGDPDTEVFAGTVTVDADTDYTVAAIGEVGDDASEPFDALVLEDDNSAVESGQARLRVVHASPDAPAVDVTAAGGDVVLFDGVPFGGSGYTTVDAGEYTVEIRGDTDGNDGDVVADFDVTLDGDAVYTAFAVGYLEPANALGDEPFDLVVSQDRTA